MKRPLVIFGAGGHGKSVLDVAFAASASTIFLIDDVAKNEVLGVPVMSLQELKRDNLGAFDFVVAIGDNETRSRVYGRLQQSGGSAICLVHPRAVVSPHACIGPGTVVMAGSVVNAGAVVGENCILNTNSSIDHDVTVGNHSHVAPGATVAGDVLIGSYVLIGLGSRILPGLRIGDRARIGAGAVVVQAALPDSTLMGVPARTQK